MLSVDKAIGKQTLLHFADERLITIGFGAGNLTVFPQILMHIPFDPEILTFLIYPTNIFVHMQNTVCIRLFGLPWWLRW